PVAEAIVARFINALVHGDEKELLGILAQDAVLVGDGGGKVPSIFNPVYGADRIARFFIGIRKKDAFEVHPAIVNSGPGMLTYRDGQLISVAYVSIRDGCISAIYSVSNPDKLHDKF